MGHRHQPGRHRRRHRRGQQGQIAGLLQDSGALPYPSVAGQFQHRRSDRRAPAGQDRSRPRRLRDCFEKKGDIINNQLAFVGNSVTMRATRTRPNSSPVTRLPPTSSRCCKRSSNPSARSAPPASTSPGRAFAARRLPVRRRAQCRPGHRRAGAALRLLSVDRELHRHQRQALDRRGAGQPALEPYDINLLKGCS
jgi:hypothetical protein